MTEPQADNGNPNESARDFRSLAIVAIERIYQRYGW